ncbi:MAG: NAD(P)H-binding protein [Actinomycetota bacterium]|nr:NAD(P)H-binding protein [Actinomycetota bacterium]
MHVFLAGATGVLGRRIVPLLVTAGHQVTALARDADRTEFLQGLGAEVVIADALDAAGLTAAVSAAGPDVLMHQLTDLRVGNRASNATLRVHGTRNLMDAARVAGVRRVVAQSIAWAYEPGDRPADEATPLDLAADEPRATMVRGVQALETAVREAPEWVVLRYGQLYGAGTWHHPDGSLGADARAGRLVADGDIASFVQADDAATAAVLALSWPTGAVNVCDDEPATGRDWVPAFRAAVGASAGYEDLDASGERQGWARGADNHRARELGWSPRYPSWRLGFASMVAGESDLS